VVLEKRKINFLWEIFLHKIFQELLCWSPFNCNLTLEVPDVENVLCDVKFGVKSLYIQCIYY